MCAVRRVMHPGGWPAFTLSWLGLVLFVIVVFWRFDVESAKRCDEAASNRAILQELVFDDAEPLTVPDGADPALREVLAEAMQRNDAFKERAQRLIGEDIVCR